MDIEILLSEEAMQPIQDAGYNTNQLVELIDADLEKSFPDKNYFGSVFVAAGSIK